MYMSRVASSILPTLVGSGRPNHHSKANLHVQSLVERKCYILANFNHHSAHPGQNSGLAYDSFVTHVQYVSVGLAFIWVLELGVAYEYGVHVAASILVELLVAGYHDHGNLDIAQDAKLVSFLQQACLTLAKCDLHAHVYATDLTTLPCTCTYMIVVMHNT